MEKILEILNKNKKSKYDLLELRQLLVQLYGDKYDNNLCFCTSLERNQYLKFVKKELNINE